MFRLFLKRCFGRRRVFVTFLVVTTLSIWYICYQAFSVHKLGEELSAESVKNKDHPYFRKYQKADIPIHLYPIDGISVEGNNEFDNSSNGGRKYNGSLIKAHPIRIKGLLIKNLKYYIPNSRGVFACLNNKQEIPYNQINNDFCDCEDGSDEPSTSACPNGRFYCGHQLKSKDVFVVSSRVNDGICDCCDGSDEWDDAEVPPHAKISEYYEEKLGIDQTPCRNRCSQ